MMNKQDKRIRLKKKIRATIRGTAERPRLSVFRSNKFISVQIINDETGRTLVQAKAVKKNAKEVGKMIAESAQKAGISKVVFDRNGFRYTGRIKLVADEARASGLKF